MPETPEPAAPAAFQQGLFCDFNTFNRMSGWDLDFKQLDAGRPEIHASMLRGQNIDLLKIRFNRGYHQRGCPPDGSLAFGIPLTELSDWHGQRIDSPSIINFNHMGGFDSVSLPEFVGLTFTINESFLHQISETCDLPGDRLFDRHHATHVCQNYIAVQALEKLLTGLLTSKHPALNRQQEFNIAAALLTATSAKANYCDTSTPAVRAHALKMALTYIEAHPREPLSVKAICDITNSSWRTVDRAFKERFGIGPKAYIRSGRLTSARADLSKSNPADSITDIANAWGFWHMGQFARDYRALFGELPSETLKTNSIRQH